MLDMLRDMGWLVVEVEGLSVNVALVRALGVVLVSSDATEDDVAEATDRLLLEPAPGAHSRT